MPARWRRGRLRGGAEAPEVGEEVESLLALPGIAIEQILSGTLAEPADYRQARDEWVVLLEGSARLVVEGEDVEIGAGEWLFLPAGVGHRLVSTAPGSSWLALHLASRA